jgi:hypothetical protein
MRGEPITGTAGVPPAMSAKREQISGAKKSRAPTARCGRDARGPSEELEPDSQNALSYSYNPAALSPSHLQIAPEG